MSDVCIVALQLLTDYCLVGSSTGKDLPTALPLAEVTKTLVPETPMPTAEVAPPTPSLISPSGSFEAPCEISFGKPKAPLSCTAGVTATTVAQSATQPTEPQPFWAAVPETHPGMQVPLQPTPRPSAPLPTSSRITAAPLMTAPIGGTETSMAATWSPPALLPPTLPSYQSNQFNRPRPQTGSQLYQQRLAALRNGQLYTRIAPDSFFAQWQGDHPQPSYQQWRALLAQEARAVAGGQGQNRLTVVVGDSLSLWLPQEQLPRDRFWLNQGISGDTTAGILQRLNYFAAARPDTIHVLAGVNDLKKGASNAEVVTNLSLIMSRLQQQHPQAEIVVHSILPTRLPSLPSDRIRQINAQVAAVAQRQGSTFLDLQPMFADAQGNLRRELTTDGLHLSRQGYDVWQGAFSRL